MLLFPGDAVFHVCKSCPAGRVIYLKFSSGRRDFFWLQEPDAAKDAALLDALNGAVNGALDGAEDGAEDGEEMDADGGGSGFGGLAEHLDEDALGLLRNLPADERLEFARNLGLPAALCAPWEGCAG